MIAFLRGSIENISFDTVVISTGGVGYGVHMHIRDVSNLTNEQQVEVHVSEIIREQAHDLYGFLSESDKRFFDQMLKVSGVGPRIALAIIGMATIGEIASAINTSNTKILTSAPGVGKRLAERIIVELKDKITAQESDVSGVSTLNVSKDAEAALLSLGFKQQDAESMLKTVDHNATIEEQVRQALRGRA